MAEKMSQEYYVEDPANGVSYRLANQPGPSQGTSRGAQLSGTENPSASSSLRRAAGRRRLQQQQIRPNETRPKNISRKSKKEIPQYRQFDTVRLNQSFVGPEYAQLVNGPEVVSQCVLCMENDQNPHLQQAAACVIANMEAENSAQSQIMAEYRAINIFVYILKSPDSTVNNVMQAIWGLGNMLAGGPALRDLVIQREALPLLVGVAKTTIDSDTKQLATRALLNIFRYANDPPNTDVKKLCLSAFAHLLSSVYEKHVFEMACSGLITLTDKPQKWFNYGWMIDVIVPRVLNLLRCIYTNIQISGLEIVGNIFVNCPAEQTMRFINHGIILPQLAILLKSNDKEVVMSAAKVLSQITSAGKFQIIAVVKNEIVPLLMEVIRTGDLSAQKFAVLAIANIATRSNTLCVEYLYKVDGLISTMCSMLTCKDWDTVHFVVDVLERMLIVSSETDDADKVTQVIIQCGGWDMIQKVMPSEKELTAYNLAYEFLGKNQTYFLERQMI